MYQNAFQLYDAAIDNAKSNDLIVDEQYLVDYAENACGIYISADVAEKMMAAHAAWADTENKSGNEHFHLVEKPLAEIDLG